MVNLTCHTCNKKGHVKFFCPQETCPRCNKVGHGANDFLCPERIVDGVILPPKFIPRQDEDRWESRIPTDPTAEEEYDRSEADIQRLLEKANSFVPDHRRAKDRHWDFRRG